MRKNWPIVLILLAYLLAGSLYAWYTPDWQAPDEPAHYNYVRQLAEGDFPIIEQGDYDQDYQSLVIGSGFDEQYQVESFEYEDYQPPLYYLLQAPVYLLFDGALRALRLLTVLLGAGVVLLAYLIVGRLFPGREWLALTTAAFVAFLPQHVAMLAAVNNDSLAELLIAAILWLLVLYLGEMDRQGTVAVRPTRHLFAIGLLLGLGFLTKATVYIMVPVIGLALWWPQRANWRAWLDSGLRLFGPALLIGLLWWGRNLIVYGGLDVLGIGAHNEVVTGQPRTAEWIAERGLDGTLQAFFQTSFQSFWGQFGWMGVPMPAWVYRPLLLFSLLTLAGLGWFLWRRWRGDSAELPPLGLRGLVLAATLGLSLLLYLAYNITFVQHQGRYLFSGLIPIALGVALGWATLLRPLAGRWPWLYYLLPFGLALLLFGLDLLALFRFIMPALG